MMCDFKLIKTENHNFTIKANTSQHVEFFHILILKDSLNLTRFTKCTKGNIRCQIPIISRSKESIWCLKLSFA